MNVPSRNGRAGRKATATDVAREAGVSKWTVNRAFKLDASIAEESRKRVLEAAERLGYRPNLLARSLSTKTTQQVALLVDDFGNPHKLPVLKTLTAALQREGLVATLINIDHAHRPCRRDPQCRSKAGRRRHLARNVVPGRDPARTHPPPERPADVCAGEREPARRRHRDLLRRRPVDARDLPAFVGPRVSAPRLHVRTAHALDGARAHARVRSVLARLRRRADSGTAGRRL